jgi:hypothetical protein
MGVVICRSSDLRYPDSRVIVCRSKRQVVRVCDSLPTGYTHPAAADESLPGWQQNWHQWSTHVYELPPGFRLRKREVQQRLAEHQGSCYRRTWSDALADVYRHHAVREVSREELG